MLPFKVEIEVEKFGVDYFDILLGFFLVIVNFICLLKWFQLFYPNSTNNIFVILSLVYF